MLVKAMIFLISLPLILLSTGHQMCDRDNLLIPCFTMLPPLEPKIPTRTSIHAIFIVSRFNAERNRIFATSFSAMMTGEGRLFGLLSLPLSLEE